MPKPRVSVVHYLNTAPLVWGMLHGEQQGRFELAFSTPAQCAGDLRHGRVDVGIIPAIEYQRLEDAQIIPGLSIASKAPVRSVLIFSKLPLAHVQSVAMDESSRTSVALTTILLRRFYGRDFQAAPHAPDAAAMLERHDAALVIGDPALAYRGSVPYTYDLASEWKKFTGLPFVFALWVGRAPADLAACCADFAASRDFGLAHLGEIAAERGPKLGMSAREAELYLRDSIDYSLDEDNLRGLSLFYKLAHELGLIGENRALHFAGVECAAAVHSQASTLSF